MQVPVQCIPTAPFLLLISQIQNLQQELNIMGVPSCFSFKKIKHLEKALHCRNLSFQRLFNQIEEIEMQLLAIVELNT